MLCLSHGKAVLCEKAFALNYEDAQEMVDCARAHDVFLMEAFWTRFHPSFMRVKAIVDSGELGEIKYIRSDFGFKAPYDPHKRLFNVALGGGSLLDIGIYPVFLALQLLGQPEGIESVADFSPTGAEQSISMIFSYTTGQQASLYSSFCVDTSIVTEVFFTRARLLLNPRWHHAPSITLFHEDGRVEQEEFPITGMGYQFEAAEVMRCMDLGNRESELMPLSFTLQQMKVLDTIRAKVGIHFDR